MRVGIVIFLWAIGLLTPALANPAEKTAERPLSKVIIAYSLFPVTWHLCG